MAKLTLPRLTGGYMDAVQLNIWAERLEAAIENTFSRDGSLPNQLSTDLDLNGNGFLNSGLDPSNPNAVLVRSDIEQLVQQYASGYVVQRVQIFTATPGQSAFTLTDFTYTPGANNLAVYVNGVREFGFTELDTSTFTLPYGAGAGQKITAVSNDYLATVSLPAHTHPWAQVIGKPDTATRWPTYAEVTDKPSSYTPSAHQHSAADITSGRLADARRGVYVQSTAPSLGPSDAGAIWIWG